MADKPPEPAPDKPTKEERLERIRQALLNYVGRQATQRIPRWKKRKRA